MKLLFALLSVIAYLVARQVATSAVRNFGQRRHIGEARIKYVTRTVNLGIFGGFLILFCLSVGLGYGEVTVFLTSVFAVLGIALFAQWSILSNLTASIIIFFGFPYRVGDRVRIVDKDEDLTGEIEEIGMYHVMIRKANGELITYPNTLILQKAVVKLVGSAESQISQTAETKAGETGSQETRPDSNVASATERRS